MRGDEEDPARDDLHHEASRCARPAGVDRPGGMLERRRVNRPVVGSQRRCGRRPTDGFDRDRRLQHGLPDHRGRRPRSSRRPTPASTISVAESGTGGGFKKFCTGETDINDASRPIKADDAAEGVACKTNSVDLRPAPGRDRRADRRREPGQHLGELPDARAAQDDLRPGLAREPDLGAGRPELPGPADRPLHARRRLRHVRLLHRGRQRQGRTPRPRSRPSPRTTTSW